MVRFSTFFILVLGILMITWLDYSTGSAITVEEQVRQLRENYIQFKEIMKAKDQQNTEIREMLTTKVIVLETKVTRLEAQLEQQNSLFTFLQSNVQTDYNLISSKIIPNQFTSKSSIGRTCREVRAANPALASGLYWIDPDGQGVGDDPINVYCDMTSGSTSVLHDSEMEMDVGHCADPGCYSRAINYQATTRQIGALSELSNECHQSIKYDCIGAPFEISGVAYAWWNDKTGKANYFWSGSNSSIHICQCGIDHNCLESFMPCNCDSSLPAPFFDSGIITDKSVLPITRLNFGRTILEYSSGVHTLGRFECSGQKAVEGMASSCEDLWRIGHTLSGLYSVMGATKVENIYCDFSKLPGDAGFQKWIGYNDVKSMPVYFYVQRTSQAFNATKTPITFDTAKLNVGGAMNLSTGKFTAPRTGTYFFSFTGMVVFSTTSNAVQGLKLDLYLNGALVGASEAEDSNTLNGQNDQLSLQSTLHLQAGDQTWIQIDYTQGTQPFLFDNPNHFTHFNGLLLEEDLSAFLLQ